MTDDRSDWVYYYHFGRQSHRKVPPVRDPRHERFAEMYAWFRTPARVVEFTMGGFGGLDTLLGIEWAAYTYNAEELRALAEHVEAGHGPPRRRATAQEILDLARQTDRTAGAEAWQQSWDAALRTAKRMADDELLAMPDKFVFHLGMVGHAAVEYLRKFPDDRLEAVACQMLDQDCRVYELPFMVPTLRVCRAAVDHILRFDRPDRTASLDVLLELGENFWDEVAGRERHDGYGRGTLIKALRRSEKPEAAELLDEYYQNDPSPKMRELALDALHASGRPAIEVGLRHLSGSRQNERLVGLAILAGHDLPPDVVAEIDEALDSERAAKVRERLEEILRDYRELSADDEAWAKIHDRLRESVRFPWRAGPTQGEMLETLRTIDDAVDRLAAEFDAAEEGVRLDALDLFVALRPDDGARLLRKLRESQSRSTVRDAMAVGILELTDIEAFSDPELDDFLVSLELEPPDGLNDMPELAWSDETPLSERATAALFRLIDASDRLPHLTALRERLDTDASSDAWHTLRERYGEESKPVRIGWVLRAAPLLGTAVDVARLGRGLNDLVANSFHEQARRTIDVLAIDGSPESIGRIEYWSRKARTSDFRRHCAMALQRVAERRGWTRDQLIERTFPRFGFDDRGRREVDFGARGTLTLQLDGDDFAMSDDSGKVWKRYPGKLADDEDGTYESAKSTLIALRREMRSSARMMADRLEEAMIARRDWTRTEFRSVVVDNPFLFHLARGIVWRFVGGPTFRLAIDRTYADVEDEPVELGDEALVRVAHPILLDEHEIEAWQEVFVDYELRQPFRQLDRDFPELPPPFSREEVWADTVHFAARDFGFVADGYDYIDRYSRPFGGTKLELHVDPGYRPTYPEGYQDVELRIAEEKPGGLLQAEAARVWQRFLERFDG